MTDHAIERPPYEDVPPSDTLGLRHLWVALSDVELPITTQALAQRYGNWRIPITGAHYHRLSEMLDGVQEGRYHSVEGIVRAIAKAHPELR